MIFHPGEVSRVSGERRSHSKNIRGHHYSPWHHSSGLGMQFGAKTQWDLFYWAPGMQAHQCQPPHPSPSSHLQELQNPSILMKASHCQAHCSQLKKEEIKKCTQTIVTIKIHEWNTVFRNWHYWMNMLSSSSLEYICLNAAYLVQYSGSAMSKFWTAFIYDAYFHPSDWEDDQITLKPHQHRTLRVMNSH